MHAYTQRNVRAWYRRFSRHGWTIRVVDRVVGSLINIENFLDISDPALFPRAFEEGTIGGDYGKLPITIAERMKLTDFGPAPQHTSDLVRWPLLLRYGGVYADAGLMQIGDINRLWEDTIGNPDSPFEVISYNAGDVNERDLTNYFLVSRPNNPLFARCHKLLLKLWEGKKSTQDMHASPLLKDLPLLGSEGNLTIEEDGKIIGPEEVSRMLTDYIIQGQVMTLVMGLVDEEDNWNGPRYVSEHVYAMEFMVGSQMINAMTDWNGQKAFMLMSLRLPKKPAEENDEQKQAREIVEACLQKSFGFKLAHGLILRTHKETLGSLWRRHEGSDVEVGTYAHWLRQGMIFWTQKELPERMKFEVIKPLKIGSLLRE